MLVQPSGFAKETLLGKSQHLALRHSSHGVRDSDTTPIEVPLATSSGSLFLFLHLSIVPSSCSLVWA